MTRYAVCCRTGPMWLRDDGILWVHGRQRPATMFLTYRAARTALKRTLIYAARHGYDWRGPDHYVIRMLDRQR